MDKYGYKLIKIAKVEAIILVEVQHVSIRVRLIDVGGNENLYY